jgi:hypothetical protein
VACRLWMARHYSFGERFEQCDQSWLQSSSQFLCPVAVSPHIQDAPRPMGAIMTARMAVGIATGAASPLLRRKDYSAGTSTTRTAQRHELQAQLRCAPVNPATPAIWIGMVMGLAANRHSALERTFTCRVVLSTSLSLRNETI